MSKFVCINFINNGIILSNPKFKRLSFFPVYFECVSIEGIQGYTLYITKEKEKLTEKFWYKLEGELLKRQVAYTLFFEGDSYPFKEIIQIKEERISYLLSKCIIDYIFKYDLVHKDRNCAKIGIIMGNPYDTADTLMPIVENIADLTLFTEEVALYQEVKEKIYQKTRLKVKIFHPNALLFSRMDIVFDVEGKGSYVNWCKPRAIYIDFKKSIIKRKIKLSQLPPSIWHDFDIIFEKRQISKTILMLMLYEQGFSNRTLRSKINQLAIGIQYAHSIPKVDKKQYSGV